jgi:2-iminobutanoate/2-iminopropanoate deaminase
VLDVFEGLDRQAPQAYQNLSAALEAAGATPSDVVKETIYIVGWDFDVKKLESLRQVRERFYQSKYPASTMVGVQALGRKEYRIEVEAVAVVS